METERPDRRNRPPGSPALDPATLGPPRIDSVAFARKGEECRGSLPLSALPRLLSAGVAPEGDLQWSVRGSTGRDELERRRDFVVVTTRFSPWMTCAKCLEPVQIPGVESTTRFRLAASESQAAQEDRESDSVEVIVADANLDLAALVEDESILALPMAPRHAACNGLAGSQPDADV